MVGSISSVSLVTGSSSTNSSTSKTDLQTQLAAKQQELAKASTADERKTVQAAIDALQQQIDGQASSSSSSGTGSTGESHGGAPAGGPPPPPPRQGNTANIGTKNFDNSTPFGNRQIYV